MKRLLLVVLSVVLVSATAEAQFFKKLKQKVEEKVEQTVHEKVSNKAAEEADRQLESIMTANLGKAGLPLGGERVPSDEIPKSYRFDWEYTMTMSTTAGEMNMVYLLSEYQPISGVRLNEAAGMTVVQDYDNQLSVMYMNSGGNGIVTATRLDSESLEFDTTENPYEDMEVRKIGTKEILGYHCQGYEMENQEYVLTYYITDEAQVNMNHLQLTRQSENIPKTYDTEWFEEENPMMMEMGMVNKQDPKKNVSMRVTNIENNDLIIRTSDYQSF